MYVLDTVTLKNLDGVPGLREIDSDRERSVGLIGELYRDIGVVIPGTNACSLGILYGSIGTVEIGNEHVISGSSRGDLGYKLSVRVPAGKRASILGKGGENNGITLYSIGGRKRFRCSSACAIIGYRVGYGGVFCLKSNVVVNLVGVEIPLYILVVPGVEFVSALYGIIGLFTKLTGLYDLGINVVACIGVKGYRVFGGGRGGLVVTSAIASVTGCST